MFSRIVAATVDPFARRAAATFSAEVTTQVRVTLAVELQNAELQLQRAGQRLGDQIRIAAAGSLGRSLDPLREELAKVSRVADALAVYGLARPVPQESESPHQQAVLQAQAEQVEGRLLLVVPPGGQEVDR
jgi:mRNA-degrading endonuclease toxin of MazEF toxin-antitoxin module